MDAAESLINFAYNTSEGRWASLRVQYAREKDSNTVPVGDFEPEDLFFEICMIVKEEMYLDVDRVIESNYEFLALDEETKRSGIPVPDLYYRKCTLSENDRAQRAAYRQQVRKTYAEFLRFMEGRYQLVLNNPKSLGIAKSRATQVMDYLGRLGQMIY